MGLGRLTNNSIIHMDLHKPNNKLVSAWLKHFGARTNHGQTQTHKTHHGPNFGEATTFPLIIYSVSGHGTSTQMSFCPKSSQFELLQLWGPITLCGGLAMGLAPKCHFVRNFHNSDVCNFGGP